MIETKELIVNLCPTGMIPTKEMTPHVPISPQEIIEDVLRCAEIGVTKVCQLVNHFRLIYFYVYPRFRKNKSPKHVPSGARGRDWLFFFNHESGHADSSSVIC